jgi:PKD repeat protein
VGTFSMRADVIEAVDVLGEYPGEVLNRRWRIAARDCVHDVCQALEVRRQRGQNLYSRVRLKRVGPGRYAGRGVFYSALSCHNMIFVRGSRAPYRITLTITGTRTIHGVRFARRIHATYVNADRSDSTPCPLGPSHDAATYTGRDTSALPTPARASFTSEVHPATQTVMFADTSTATRAGGRIVRRRWSFGDRNSGIANGSTRRRPRHVYTQPGSYLVTLTVTNADGLRSTSTHTVLVPGPPTAMFTYTGSDTNVTFSDQSQPGRGASPIVFWEWNFGDPSTGSGNTSTSQNPSHMFSGPGTYTVTLMVTDENGRTQSTAEAVTITSPAAMRPVAPPTTTSVGRSPLG